MAKIFFLFLLSPFLAFSQERANSELPKIIDTIASLESAKGWVKNDIGKWVSKHNAIPSKNSEIDLTCADFVEYTILKISYKEELYFCLLQINKNDSKFWLFNDFLHAKIDADTLLSSVYQPMYKGDFYSTSNLNTNLVNEIFKKFEDKESLAEINKLNIDLSINKTKKYIRFFISDEYFSWCIEDDKSLEKRYFETNISNLSFFENLVSLNTLIKMKRLGKVQ